MYFVFHVLNEQYLGERIVLTLTKNITATCKQFIFNFLFFSHWEIIYNFDITIIWFTLTFLLHHLILNCISWSLVQ